MLRAPWYLGNGAFYKQPSVRILLLKLQIFQAFISTNTAINKSLRRSQLEAARPGRRFSGRDERNANGRFGRVSPRERTRRPNHQQGQDVEDVEEFTRVNERNKTLKRARPTHRRATTDRRGTAFDRRLREAQRDYTPKPGGNRAIRRAVRFGHTIEEPLKEASNSTVHQGIYRKETPRDDRRSAEPGRSTHGARRASKWNQGKDDYQRFSMPEDLREDSEIFTELPRRSFTIGRREEISYRAIYANGSRDVGRESSRSRPYEGYGRDRPRDHDRSPRNRDSDAPLSMPYTTPASEFLYGTSVVVSALLSSRRKLYKLYIYDGDNREVRDQDMRIRSLAVDRNVVVERVKGDWLRLMDKMSTGRPHNVR